jgi:hypothetical protein
MSTATALNLSPAPASLLGRPIRWLQQARDRRRCRLLDEAFTEARLALGRRMYAAGIDDGETGEQIAALDAALAADGTAGDAQDLRARRTLLLIRLADAALENDAPLPGADAEFAHALELKRSLEASALAG